MFLWYYESVGGAIAMDVLDQIYKLEEKIKQGGETNDREPGA